MLKLRTATYNPLSVQADSRLEDIASETVNFDILALIGTQRPQYYDDFSSTKVSERQFIHGGHKRSATEANRSCGCGFLLGKRFKEGNIVKVSVPKASLAGRGIAVHLKSAYYDIQAFAAYFPPRPSGQRGLAKYYSSCRSLSKWMDQVATSCAGITSPLFFMDVNDGIGIQQFKKTCTSIAKTRPALMRTWQL